MINLQWLYKITDKINILRRITMTRERAEEECMSLGEAYTEGYQQGRCTR